jgi:RNA recognition motif-containing protein
MSVWVTIRHTILNIENGDRVSKRLRVGNLGLEMDIDQFKQIFSEFGTVTTAQIVMSNFDGKSRGFGFIEMSTPEEAAKCITQFAEAEHAGRKLAVSEAPDEKKKRTPRAKVATKAAR